MTYLPTGELYPMSDYQIPNSIRENVNLLGTLLGETIADAEGAEFLDKIEHIRALAKEARASQNSDYGELAAYLNELPTEELLPVARSFSHFLNLANIADQHHSVSREMDSVSSATQTLDELFTSLADAGHSRSKITRWLHQLKIDLVLTAHPTEITRRSLITKYAEINSVLSKLELQGLTGREQKAAHLRLSELVAQLWHTGDFRENRPTPVDEARWGFAVIENSLWKAVPYFMRRLATTSSKIIDEPLPEDFAPISFTFWMGGDRDGNPNVTAKISREVLLLARWKAVDLYLKDIQELIEELSMSKCSPAVAELAPNVREPYRHILRGLRAMLQRTLSHLDAELRGEPIESSDIFEHVDQLRGPLRLCHESLHQNNMGIIADGKLLDLLRRVDSFGVHLVKLDIRQESDRHTAAINELTEYLGIGSYHSWSEADKQTFLLKELQNKRPLISPLWKPSPEVQEVLDTCREISRHPRSAFGVYVISMARQASDVLAVHLLMKECGCATPLDVAPLFETLDDLNRSADVIEHLVNMPWYRGQTNQKQTVMIGYSDSAKDAGVLAAGWAQYRAQEGLLKICDAADISLTLFHGRGGTIGRGGAPAHAALLSQPPGSLTQGLRVTEQGEMIRAKLGLPSLAIKSLALYTSAILQANLEKPPVPLENWRHIMDHLSDLSCAEYRRFVREEPRFVPYFRMATPEQELTNLPLGSRPARRKTGGGIESLRAIPWIFAWSQNRLMLPAWLGAGAALQQVIDEGGQGTLEEMCQLWPFFSTRISMLEMVYAKADVGISEYYDSKLVEDDMKPLGVELRAQLEKDVETILGISNDESLMEDVPAARASIEFRHTYVDPLNLLQAELLQRNRGHEEETLKQALMVTIAGISAGLRNTG